MNSNDWVNSRFPSARLAVQGKKFDVQAILFDKDGTLLDFIHTWGTWGELLLARFSSELKRRGMKELPSRLLNEWGIGYDEDGEIAGYDRNSPLSMGTVDDLLTLLALEGYKSGLSWAEARVLAAECRQEADEALERSRTARLLPDVLPFLEQCKLAGIRLGIVTSDETESAEKHLGWLGIRSFFSVCIGADRVSRGKPFPDMVELACRRIDVEMSRTAVIGDTNGDMLMARSAGTAAAIGLDPGHAAGKGGFPEADAVVASYRELDVRKGE
ncbi:HAD family hydrolase [Paenibacillus macerans]|uniref:HAD family hydrolase n=1 Tax=Paenibacillus macerans TaxID=44252 RepID=UPI003D30F69B